MQRSALSTRTSPDGGQRSARGGRQVDRFIVHHAAMSSLSGYLSMVASDSKEVSSHYSVCDDEIVSIVPEEYRAWTSASAEWDGRAITVETINSATGDASGWPISEASYQSLARLIADVATRYGFPIDRDHVLGHRELYTRYGASYSTACPGGIDLDRLVTMAQAAQQKDFLMALTDQQQDRVLALLEGLANGSLPKANGYPFPHRDAQQNNLETIIVELRAIKDRLSKLESK